MRTNKQILESARRVLQRQAVTSGFDFVKDGERLHAIMNNVLTPIFVELDEAREEIEALREVIRLPRAIVYLEGTHDPLPGPGFMVGRFRHVAGCQCTECEQQRRAAWTKAGE